MLAIGGGGGCRMHLRRKIVGEEVAVPEELRLECGHRAAIQLGGVGVRVWRVVDSDHGRWESGASDHRNTAKQSGVQPEKRKVDPGVLGERERKT